MTLIPNDGFIVVKPIKTAKNSQGGLYLPDTATNTVSNGEVIFVGNGEVLYNGTRAEMNYAVGDFVYYPSHSGTKIDIDSVEHVILRRTEVLVKSV